MNQLQTEIYSNDYTELIIPYSYTSPEIFQQSAAAYNPQIINELYAFIHLDAREYTLDNPDNFLYSLFPNLFVPLDTTSLEVSGILRVQNQTNLSLKGQGILIGFIDTGIDYTHPAFLGPANRTRILRIWDQTIPDESNKGPFGYGTEYTKEQINQALASEQPLTIVPSTDTNGHGTMLAGVAAGTADPESEFSGAAPEADIAVVRLKEAKQHLKDFYFFSGNIPVYQETDLMTGIQYLRNLSRKLQKPLVLCIALGSNQGDHLGYSPLEISMRQFEIQPGIAVVCAAGNEAGKAHHFFGSAPSVTTPKSVEIFVREETRGFSMELWGQPPELFSIGFRSPGGEQIPRIPTRLGRTEVVRFFLEKTVIYINYELVQNPSGSQLIFIRFDSPTPGIWSVDVYDSSRISGEFHMWLPVSGFQSPDVTFLTPDPYTTITMPGNSANLITVAAYSAYTGSLYLNSSRGYTRNNQVKPDFTAPGVDVTAPNLRKSYTTVSSTSAASALASGSCALLLEWSILQNSYPLFSSYQIKNLLIRGADKNPMEIYPNREWGFGTMNLYQVFSSISTI